MARVRSLLGLAVALTLASGCGALLGLEEGEPRDDAEAGADATVDTTSDTGAEASGDVTGSDAADAATSDAPDVARPPDGDAGCGAGTTLCSNGLCEPTNDPGFGCGNSKCSPCTVANGTATCGAGGCAVGACDSNHADCDKDASNGCEVDLTLAKSCGACNVACDAGDSCQNKACVSGCPYSICSGVCTNVNTDPGHCGSCTVTCQPPNGATATCDAGTCGYSCVAPYADCDGLAFNGCETNLSSDPRHCGTCTNDCTSVTPAHAIPACSGTTCTTSGCYAPYISCGGICNCDTTLYTCNSMTQCVLLTTKDAGTDGSWTYDSGTADTYVPPDSSLPNPDAG